MSKPPLKTIVIVEDENITALDIRKRLQRLGYEVLATASSGEEALAKVAEFRPDLVLMDIVLKSSIDGVQAAGMIRDRHNIPVVYLTAFSDNDTLQRAKVTEPFGYVLKPFEERDLHATIEMALYKHNLEKKLQESEQRFRSLIQHSSDVITIHDENGTIRYSSDSSERILGYKPEQLVGHVPFEFLHPDDVAVAQDEFSSMKVGRNTGLPTPLRFCRPDGSLVYLESMGTNLLDRSEVNGIVITSRDVTDRKKTEGALVRSQGRLAQLNECLLSFGPDSVKNINQLVALCGEQLGATAALYNRLEGENLVSLGCWNTPPDFVRVDKAEGHVCYDVIRRNQPDACLIRNLHESGYAATDPNVNRYGLKTYVGKAVTFANSSVGSLCVVYQRDYVASDEDLKLLGIVASAIGVEEKRKRAEEELRLSENQYRLLFMENPQPIWVYDRETLRFLAVNEAAIRHYGYSRDEFLSLTVNDIRPGDDAESSLKDPPTVAVRLDDPGIWRHRKKDGSIAFIEATTRTTKFLGRDAAIVVVNDITSRKQSKEKITMFGHAIDSIGEAVSITDLSNRILFVNGAFLKIYGYKEQELVGKSISIVRSPNATSPDLPTILARTLQGGWHGELTNRRKNGTDFSISLSTSVVYDNKGRAIALVGVAQDISQQKQFEQQVRQSQKMESMGTMVGGISHDFNNILNNILGFVYQLRKYSHDQEKVAKYTDTIEKSATRGAELANQLLSIVRRKKRDDEQVNINALVNDVASLMRETFPKNITLEMILPSKVLTTMGNHGELDQAVLNLCLNARDAMPDGGKLSIEVAEDEIREEIQNAVLAPTFPPGQTWVKIQIRDSGTGIPKPILDQIFDPFFTTKDRGKGTGLGLSVVYSIVKNHRGTIVVDTEEGRGSTFALYLPTVEVEHKEMVGEEVAVPPVHSDGFVLLVDDEASMRELGRELLEDQGYKVIVAHDGLQAVEIYRERWKEVALVVLDLVMPRLDGGQAFLEMKKINPGIKAFFCTGYSSDHVISSLLSEEHLCALQKPFRPAEFAKMVRETLSG